MIGNLIKEFKFVSNSLINVICAGRLAVGYIFKADIDLQFFLLSNVTTARGGLDDKI